MVRSLVLLAGVVNGSNGQGDVVHVSHAVSSSKATVTVRRRDVHFLSPPHVGTGQVEVVFPESIARTGEFVAQGPGHGDDVERRRAVGKEERRRWRLRFVGVLHVDIQVTATVVVLRNVERQGVKHIDRHDVAVGCKAIGGGNGDRLLANLLEQEDHVAVKDAVTRRTGFGRRHGDEGLVNGTVDIGQAGLEVDDHLLVGFQREGFDVRHVDAGSVVDGVDADGDRLVGVLLAVAGAQGNHRLPVNIVVYRLVAERSTTKFHSDGLWVGVVHDLEREAGGVNGLSLIIRVGEVGAQRQDTAAALVHALDGKALPAGLAVFDDVEEKGPVGQLTGVAVVATVVNVDFNALLAVTTVLVGEEDFQFFGGGMPSHEVVAVRRHDELRQRRFWVGDVADHAHLGVDVAHNGGHGVCCHGWPAVGEGEGFGQFRPHAGLSAVVHRSGADVVGSSRHGHAGRDDVFSALSRLLTEEDVLSAGNDACIPRILSGG